MADRLEALRSCQRAVDDLHAISGQCYLKSLGLFWHHWRCQLTCLVLLARRLQVANFQRFSLSDRHRALHDPAEGVFFQGKGTQSHPLLSVVVSFCICITTRRDHIASQLFGKERRRFCRPDYASA